MSEQKIVNIENYSDNITLPTEKEILDTNTLKKNENAKNLFENKSIKGDSMTEYITKEAFNQYEKRVDQNINHLETNVSQKIDHLKSSINTDISSLNSKIDSLPSQIEDKFKILINDQYKEMQKERKEDRKSIITWCLTGTGLIITALGLIAKILNWI